MKLTMILIGILAATGCGRTEPRVDGDELWVLVTLPPQADMVNGIAGDRVHVTTLVPEGQSPHIFEPVPSQMRAAAQARAWFTVGSGVEYEVVHGATVRQQNPSLNVVDTHAGIPLRPWSADESETADGSDQSEIADVSDQSEHSHHEHTTDPHVWLTPANARIMADNILVALVELDPAGEADYRDGHAELIAALDLLHDDLQKRLSACAGATLLVYHPSWGYFADAYDLEQLAIEEEGRKPGIVGVAAVVELARQQNIEVVFASPQSDASSAEVVATEIGGRVVRVDPLAADYRTSMRTVAEALMPGEVSP